MTPESMETVEDTTFVRCRIPFLDSPVQLVAGTAEENTKDF